jgi:hypothetical protein
MYTSKLENEEYNTSAKCIVSFNLEAGSEYAVGDKYFIEEHSGHIDLSLSLF